MEDNHGDWILTYSTYTILHKHRQRLEARHKVKFEMPELETNSPSGDKIFVRIIGNKRNIGFVKNFIKRKSKLIKSKQSMKSKEASIIVLDSDSEDAVAESEPMKKQPNLETPEVCEVTSTTDADESVIVLEPPPAEEFIPITENKKRKRQPKSTLRIKNPPPNNHQNFVHGSQLEVIEIDLDEENAVNQSQVKPIPIPPPQIENRLLRPIVIDGQNVARQHGKATNTFSCQGIKICVDYFLARGHTNVTALLPQFRKFCKGTHVKTTDQHLLDELEKAQHLAYTPSRRIDGVAYNCYDDRFIVSLASQNGGVILSNDHYKDLIDENPLFAETIKNRLLMFCFVGDILLIPDDPLGSKGPKLAEYLSFPPTPTPSDNETILVE